jgi:hypothetical protein
MIVTVALTLATSRDLTLCLLGSWFILRRLLFGFLLTLRFLSHFILLCETTTPIRYVCIAVVKHIIKEME